MIIHKLSENYFFTEEETQNMHYFDKMKILNNNYVLVAKHFQYCGEVFLKEIILDDTFGKVKHYAIRAEFQVTKCDSKL